MNFKEKSLYHQIHPAKLLTDWITTVPSLFLLWNPCWFWDWPSPSFPQS